MKNRGRTMRRVIKPMCMASVTVLCGLILVCCNGKTEKANAVSRRVNLMEESQLLRLYDCGQYHMAEVVNPWDTTRLLKSYLIVDRGVTPDSLPDGDFVRIDVPLERTLVYSSVHTGLIDAMGAGNAVAGVAEGQYFTGEMAARIKRGDVTDVGSSQSPSLEAIVALKPDAILVSPFENAGHGVIEQAGVPIVECADYMEKTPKGRAEWGRFFGLLYGKNEGDSIYRAVAGRYDRIAALVKNVEYRPLVLTEMLHDGYWFVPGGGSYMAKLLQDAGACYPWGADTSTGSLQLDFSTVYSKAADADFWLIRDFRDLTLDDIKDEYLLNGQFKAFKEGNVFVANTSEVAIFDEIALRPDNVLEEFVKIFHPEVIEGETRFFKRAK